MHKYIRPMLLALAVLVSAPLFGATAVDFYVSLLRRGAADVEAGRNAEAVTPLRLAAFGLVESVPDYETALAYLTIAHDRLKQQDRVRDTAMRILAAERVERRFASLTLPATIRSAFEAAARKVLTSTEVAALSAPVPSTTTAATTTPATTTPATQTPNRASESSSRPVESSSRPVVESSSKPAPAQTTTTTTTNPPATTPTNSNNTTNNSSSTTRRPDDSTPPKPNPPRPQPTQPAQPAPQPTRPATPAVDVPARLAAAERALGAANLTEARRIYRELLEQNNLEHATWIRIAEGLYRSRDFANTLIAFQRAGALRAGEEAYRYYVAVALYETGQYERARRELTAALPHIELTPDVQRYRAKIEGAR